MEYRRSIIILILGIFLFSMVCVCASDVNDAPVASEDTEVEISQIEEISADDDSQLIGQCNDKETVCEGNVGTFHELQDNISNTESGKTLTLERNYEYDNNFGSDGIVINKSITIEGNGHVIDGAKQGRIFFINATEKIVLNNITFKNAYIGSGAAGGAIVFNNSNAVVVSNCIFENCKAYNAGAILFNNSSNCNVSDCTFLNDSADCDAGAVEFIRSNNCSVFNCDFVNNSAGFRGGAIYWGGSNGYLVNISIFNASANATGSGKSSNGGAIFYEGHDGTLINASISNTFAAGNGGAIYWSGNNGYLVNISIFNASANATGSGKSSNGGAIFYDGPDGTLINANISNTFAAGNGGAIYWKGSSPDVINNISITHSRTEVIDSTNSADGGAIYATTITQLGNVYISDAQAHKNQGDVHGGAIYWKDGRTLNNITIIASGASTDNGISYGGAIYSERKYGSTSIWVYNSTFEQNNADLGGGLYFEELAGKIYESSFAGNVADSDGGAVYVDNQGMLVQTSTFEYNSAKKGGAIFAQNAYVQINASTLEFNAAEEKGGAVYYDYTNNAVASRITGTDLANNTAFQGSAIYGTKFNKFSLENVVLLDNRANSNGFIEITTGIDGEGHAYVSGVFVGFDNLLNAIWQEATSELACSNVTYWGVGGKAIANGPPDQSDREANINVIVEVYDENCIKLSAANVVTDKNGKFNHTFDAEKDKTYHFAFVQDDELYTDLRDTISNSSHVKINANASVYYSQNQTFLIELTDGAGGNMSGTVSVTFNDSEHTSFTIEVINGTGVKSNCTYLPIGHYNATALFTGDINHTGDSDWVLFEVLPYYDLQITNDVNVTVDALDVKDIIMYTINVTNHGPSKAYGVNVTEVLSTSLKLITSKATIGNYNSTEGYWYIGELDVNHFETLTIIAEIVHMGEINNTVWVTGLGKDTNESNNVDSAHNFTAMAVVDLSVNKTSDKDEYCIGDIAVWTITVCNAGNGSNASNVVLYDYFPGDNFEIIAIAVDSGTYTEVIKDRYYLWDIGFMEKGSNATMVITSHAIQARDEILNFASIFSSENEWDYENNVARKTVDVIKPNSTVNVNSVVLNYGESTNVTVTTEGTTGITAMIDNKPVSVINNYTIPISGLDVGTHTLTVTTIPDANHNEVTRTANITVTKANPKIKMNVTLKVDTAIIDVATPEDVTNPVLVDVDGRGYYVNITGGKGQLTIPSLAGGLHNVTAKYYGDDRYNQSEPQSGSFDVCNIPPVVSVKVDNITYGDKAVIEVTVPVDATGNVTVTIDRKPYYANVSGGKAVLVIPGLTAGDKTVEVTYNGDYKYFSESNSTNFTVSVADVGMMMVIAQNITYGENEIITVYVDAEGNVTFKINNQNYDTVNITDGKAVFSVPLNAGNYTVEAIYNGQSGFNSKSVETNFTVEMADPIISIEVQNITFGGVEHIRVHVNAEGDVTIRVKGTKIVETISLENGEKDILLKAYSSDSYEGNATMNIFNLKGGRYPVEVTYNGNSNYNKFTAVTEFEVYRADISMNVEVDPYIEAGEDQTINITMGSVKATGWVYFYLAGSVSQRSISDGFANFTTSLLEGGKYQYVIYYKGDDNFNPYIVQGTFEVGRAPSLKDVSIDLDVVPYLHTGETQVINITMSDSEATGKVTIILDNNNYTKILDKGFANFTTPVLPDGDYTVVVIYEGNYMFNSNWTYGAFVVGYIPNESPLDVMVDNITYGDKAVIEVTVPVDATGNVTVTIGGKPYSENVSCAKAIFIVEGLDAGNYTVNVTYNGDEKYASNNTSTKLEVCPIKIDKKDILVVDQGNGTVVVVVFKNAGGNITVKVGENAYNSTIVNRMVVINLDNETPGTHDIDVIYWGDGNHEGNSIASTITIPKFDSPMSVDALPIECGNPAVIIVTLPENATGNVTIEIDGIRHDSEEIKDGKAEFNIKNLTAGIKTIFVDYEGDDNYIGNHTTANITVTKANPEIKMTVVVDGDTAFIDIDAPEEVIKPVLVDVDGVGYYVNITDGKGRLVIPSLTGGMHEVIAKFTGDDRYNQSELQPESFEVCNVPSVVSVKADNIIYGDKAAIEVTVPDDATGNVTVTIGGKLYSENVSCAKTILIVEGLGAGNYTVNVTYNGDEKYASGSDFTNLEVSKAKTFIKVIDNGNGAVVVFVSDNVSANVTVKVGNNIYDAVVEDSIAVIGLVNETYGAHNIEVICEGDENHTAAYANASIIINKFKTQITANAITTTYNVNKDLVISLKDVKGNPISGAKITVDLNGVKTYATDKNGNIKVSTKGLAANTYTVPITFAGNENYEKSMGFVKVSVKKATPKITAKKKTFKAKTKTKKYTATLKDNTGKAMKKVKVTLKVKGKTYEATTNSKGKATFKIKSLNKKGKYTAVIKYDGDKNYKKVTKKVKLTVKASKKKSTFKTQSRGSKDKATVKKIQRALKNNGYYLTYKGHYLKIDGIYHGYTQRSVKEFQHDKGLKVTGKVDEKTAKKLGII